MYRNYPVVLPMIAFWMSTDTYDIVLTDHQYSPEHQAARKEITARNAFISALWRRYLQSAMTLGVIGHVYDLLVLLGYGEESFVKKKIHYSTFGSPAHAISWQHRRSNV